MMRFVCIKWGEKYSAKYVNSLYRAIYDNFRGYEFILTCFTDEPEDIIPDVQCVPIPDDGVLHPKYWYGKENFCWDRTKFLLGNAHNWLNWDGPFCYFDLDVVILDNIDHFYEMAFKPHILKSYWQPEHVAKERLFQLQRGTFLNSSCMLWWNNQLEKFYHDVISKPEVVFKTYWKGSDNYYAHRTHMVAGDDFWNFIDEDDYCSFNYSGFDENKAICIFNRNLVPGSKAIGLEDAVMQNRTLYERWHNEQYDAFLRRADKREQLRENRKIRRKIDKKIFGGLIIELTAEDNDTGNWYNDYWKREGQLTLKDIKTFCNDFEMYWVVLTSETAEVTNAKDFVAICAYFKERDCNVIVRTFTDVEEIENVDEIIKTVPEDPIEKENEIITDAQKKVIDIQDIKKNQQLDETRRKTIKRKIKVECEHKKNGSYYIDSTGAMYPCIHYARDIIAAKVLPSRYKNLKNYAYNVAYDTSYTNIKFFNEGEIIYSSDMTHIVQNVDKNPTEFCLNKCGKCK